MIRKLFGSVVVVTLAVCASPASGQTPFGPIESRTFHWKPGASIELPPADGCQMNVDWLLIRAPGIANAKSVDVTPKVGQTFDKQGFPSSNCAGPDCLPLWVKVTARDVAGPRTVTAKHADGRTITTTMDVVANAGRCDYPKK